MFLKCKIMDYIGIPCELVHTPLQDYLTCDEIRHFKVTPSNTAVRLKKGNFIPVCFSLGTTVITVVEVI